MPHLQNGAELALQEALFWECVIDFQWQVPRPSRGIWQRGEMHAPLPQQEQTKLTFISLSAFMGWGGRVGGWCYRFSFCVAVWGAAPALSELASGWEVTPAV